MATEIPSHNLREVASATLMLLRDPKANVDDVLRAMPGPDFPGGGQIISSAQEIRDIYASGRGSLKVRARSWVHLFRTFSDARDVTRRCCGGCPTPEGGS